MAVTWTTQRSGNWSLSSTNASSPWYDGGTQTGYARTPGSSSNANNDLVVIANGHTLTCDAGVTCGDAATVSNLAISTAGSAGTGILAVSPGVVLTVVSNVKQGNANWTVTGGVGQTTGITFNASTAPTWQVADGTGRTGAKLTLAGVSGGRITVTSTGAANGSFPYGGWSLQQHDWSYVDASNLGGSSTPSVYGNLEAGGAYVLRFANCTFANCGGVTAHGVSSDTTAVLSNCTFSGTLTTYSVGWTCNSAIGTGTRTISNCVFDKSLGAVSHFRDFAITGNFFSVRHSINNSNDYPWAQFSNNFCVGPESGGTLAVPSAFSSYTNPWNYYHIHNPAGMVTNWHGPSPQGAASASSVEISGVIFDPGNTDTVGDLLFLPPSTVSCTANYRYNLVLPIATGTNAGLSVGKLISAGPSSAAGTLSANADHNTVCASGTGEVGIVQWGETWKGRAGLFPSCRSNIAFSPTGSTAGVKVQLAARGSLQTVTVTTTGAPTVNVTGSGFSAAVSAGDWLNIAADTTTQYQVQAVVSDTQLTLATPYPSNVTSQPGRLIVQDVIAAADYNAGYNLATGTDGKGYNSSISGGKIFSGTHGAHDVALASMPFVDPTRNVATWAVYKGQAVSGDTYQTKVTAAYAYLKGDPSGRIADLVNWVKAGWTVTDASLYNAGHDGATIGALPYLITATATGSVTLAALGVSGAGGPAFAATGSISFGPLAVAGAGVHASAGAGTVALGPFAAVAAATPGVFSAGAISLGPLAVSASCAFTAPGLGSVAMATLATAGVGRYATAGAGAVSLGPLTVVGQAGAGVFGYGTVALAAMACAGPGSYAATGLGALTLGPLAVLAPGTFSAGAGVPLRPGAITSVIGTSDDFAGPHLSTAAEQDASP